MATISVQERDRRAWELVEKDHEIVTHRELLDLGFTTEAIRHRLRIGRLHRKARGVYKAGSPNLSREGRWMVAVKTCGERAALSHLNAAFHWRIRSWAPRRIHVSVPAKTNPRPHDVEVHRRAAFESVVHRRIPVTTPTCTVIDLATLLGDDELEAAINQADILGLTNAEELRQALQGLRRPGAARLRRLLDIRTFRFTRSALERAFIPIALRAGLPRPLTAQLVNGVEVDFYWPELDLVVETDGLTYHRTPSQQAKDLKRDHRHFGAEVLPLRFSHGQIRYEPEYVEGVLTELPARTPRLPRAA
jgi:predicted transcriptional regulator of viral defense system/very-short-patch-repair endonuclease